MGDPRRFNLMADFVAERIAPESSIADVAAGKGHLSLALRERGFQKITSYEPAPRARGVRGLRLRAELFTLESARPFDVLVGMHPDGATEEIVCGAARHGCRMFLVPCCAVTSRTAMWDTNNWQGWIDHILRLCHKHGLKVERTRLPMSGRNQMIWTPER